MKPVFVKKWHGIDLLSIYKGDSRQRPDNNFYSNFYKEFFKSHLGWSDLNPNWVDHKMNNARFILSRLSERGRTLSIGCGLGIIEKFLLENGLNNLEIQEISEEPLHWIKPLFSDNAIHIGIFPECLNSSEKFEYIYISIIDYCFNQDEWITFLKSVREHLNDNGHCLVVSPSFRLANYSAQEICLWIKARVKHVLSFFGLYNLGQMMGWRRSRDEFLNAMEKAGFGSLNDGFTEKDALVPRTFWVEGSNKP